MYRLYSTVTLLILISYCYDCAFVPSALQVNNVKELKNKQVKEEVNDDVDVGNLVQVRSTSKPKPTVTVDVMPGTAENTQDGRPDTLFYPQSNQAFLFNFTCTIKHPNFNYRMEIVREQTINGKVETLNFLRSGSYDKNPEIKDNRIQVEFSEPDWFRDSANYIRVTVLIRKISLKDNGLYKCSYSTLSKQKEIVIYKSMHPKNVELDYKPLDGRKVSKSSNTIDLKVGEETSLICKVVDIYPKPDVSLSIDNRLISKKGVTTKDVSSPKRKDFDGFTVQSNVTYKAIYSDNLKPVECRGSLNLKAENTNVTRVHKLNITGIQIIDDSCEQYPTVEDVGAVNFQIKCRFFANPRRQTTWQTEVVPPQDKKQPNNTNDNLKPKNLGETKSAAVAEPVFQEISVFKSNNYKEMKNVHLGGDVYQASITIKKVGLEDLKKFKFVIYDDAGKKKALNKVIELHTKESFKKLKLGNSSSSLYKTQLHSRVYNILISVFTIAFMKYLNR